MTRRHLLIAPLSIWLPGEPPAGPLDKAAATAKIGRSPETETAAAIARMRALLSAPRIRVSLGGMPS